MVRLLLLVVLVLLLVTKVQGAAFSFWDNPSCTGTPNSVDGSIPSDGTCFVWQGAIVSLTCSSPNTATFIVFLYGCNGIPIAAGTGTGDGSTCIPLSNGNTPASAIKVACNSNTPPIVPPGYNSAVSSFHLSSFFICSLVILSLFLLRIHRLHL